MDVVFNYGTFSFDEDFYFNFAMGRLNYMLATSSMPDFVRSYQYDGRGITEQVLDLDQDQKQAVFDFLVWNVQPENRFYLYDFFYDNCSSRLRDVLDTALGTGSVAYPDLTLQGSPTYRNLIDEYLIYHPWGDFGIDLGLGLPCDKVVASRGYMFLPNELMRAFDQASVEDKPLVKETRTILEPAGLSYRWSLFDPTPLLWVLFGLVAIITALGIRNNRLLIGIDVAFLIVTGAVGGLVFFLWFITDHNATASNFNMLWAWPTHLIMLFLMWNRSIRRMYWLIYGSVLLLTIIMFPFLPQSLHIGVIPLILMSVLRAFANWRLPLNTETT